MGCSSNPGRAVVFFAQHASAGLHQVFAPYGSRIQRFRHERYKKHHLNRGWLRWCSHQIVLMLSFVAFRKEITPCS